MKKVTQEEATQILAELGLSYSSAMMTLDLFGQTAVRIVQGGYSLYVADYRKMEGYDNMVCFRVDSRENGYDKDMVERFNVYF